MKRRSAWLLVPLMLVTAVVAAAPASAANAQRDSRLHVVAGQYTAYGKWDRHPYLAFSLTLNRDHTGTDLFGDTIVWSISGKSLTMTFDDGLWTYLGTKTRTGFNSLAQPGTLSNVNGGSGTWYAVLNG